MATYSSAEVVFAAHRPPRMSDAEDLRMLGPVAECVCGSTMFHALVSFDDDGDLSGWLLDGVCAGCGRVVTLPCPADQE